MHEYLVSKGLSKLEHVVLQDFDYNCFRKSYLEREIHFCDWACKNRPYIHAYILITQGTRIVSFIESMYTEKFKW